MCEVKRISNAEALLDKDGGIGTVEVKEPPRPVTVIRTVADCTRSQAIAAHEAAGSSLATRAPLSPRKLDPTLVSQSAVSLRHRVEIGRQGRERVGRESPGASRRFTRSTRRTIDDLHNALHSLDGPHVAYI